MTGQGIRALCDPRYTYYKLTQPFGLLTKGTIFYHDPLDNVYGSLAEGCLKLCWSPDGECQCGLAGGTVIFHYEFTKTPLFEKIQLDGNTLMKNLSPGHYDLKVSRNGAWVVTKYGDDCGNYYSEEDDG